MRVSGSSREEGFSEEVTLFQGFFCLFFFSCSSCRMSPKGIRNSVYPKACGNSPLCVIIGVLECKKVCQGWGMRPKQEPESSSWRDRRMGSRSEMKAITLVHQVKYTSLQFALKTKLNDFIFNTSYVSLHLGCQFKLYCFHSSRLVVLKEWQA